MGPVPIPIDVADLPALSTARLSLRAFRDDIAMRFTACSRIPR